MRMRVVATGRTGAQRENQVDLAPTDTTNELYNRVAQAIGTRPNDFRLTYNEKPIDAENRKVEELGLKDGGTLYAAVIADGGAIVNAIKKILNMGGNSHQVPTQPFSPWHSPSPSEKEWLVTNYTNMLIHQPAARAVNLRHYELDFRPLQGQFAGQLFHITTKIPSPYNPPQIYVRPNHGHPNIHKDGRLCIVTPWQPFGGVWEFIERVKMVLTQPNYHSRVP